MKHKLQRTLACLLVLTLFTCPVIAASPFPDVDENAEYAPAVEYLESIGVIAGDENGNFNPNATVTRAEMAVIICWMMGRTDDLPSREDFTDVPLSHWANGYVSKAVDLGIVSGYGNGKFGPADKVTFEQAVTMLVQAMGLGNEAIAAGGYPDGYLALAQERGYTSWISIQKGESLLRWQVAIILYSTL